MSFLEDVKKKLTGPGGEAFSQERFAASKPPGLGAPPAAGSQTADQVPPYLFDAAAAARRRRKRMLWGALLLAAVVAVAGATYGVTRWYRVARMVHKEQIDLTVQGPERITSGDEVRVTVGLKNASRVGWENVTVVLETPDGFTVKSAVPAPAGAPPTPSPSGAPAPRAVTWAVGNLPARASTDLSVAGRLVGEEGTSALFTGLVTLTPANRTTAPPPKTALASVALAGIPIDLSLDVPQRASSGTPIVVHVAYQNRTANDLEGARIVLEVPQGFTVSASSPPVAGRELAWELPAVPPQAQGEITVSGTIEGDPDTTKPFVARVGFLTPDGRFLVQRQVQRSLEIARAALSMTQAMNGERDLLKANPGDEVQGRVVYKNTGTGGLREVIVKLTFEGTGLDVGSVRVQGGFFSSRQKTITWSTASSPQLRALRPGEAGELAYSFKLLPVAGLPFASEKDRNFQLVTQAVGDSPDLPTPPGAPKEVVTDRFELLINSVPAIVLGAFFDDGRAGLPVSQGPLPPQVGKETILTVRARITNTSNELIDGTYQTVLPEGVRWVGKEYHTTGTMRFNERTRDVTWTIPLLAARAGAALPAPEFAFQVGITPSLNQVGSEVPLTRGHVFEATDAFTTSRLRAEGEAVTTRTVDEKNAEVVR